MLNRRSFFAAIFAAPAAAASLPQTTRGPSADSERIIEYVLSRNQFLVDSICKLAAENEHLRDYRDRQFEVSDIGRCVCGSALMWHGHAGERTEYFTCTARDCPQFDVPLMPPRIAVERADPEIVQRVQAEEAAERRRDRENQKNWIDSEYQKDLKFYSGDRWPAASKRSR